MDDGVQMKAKEETYNLDDCIKQCQKAKAEIVKARDEMNAANKRYTEVRGNLDMWLSRLVEAVK